MPETKDERKRRLAKERQQRRRAKLKAHKQAVGAHIFRFEMYRGTADALERLRILGGYEERAEVITLLIHNADDTAKRDPSRFKELTTVAGHASQ